MHSFIEIHNKSFLSLPFILNSIGRSVNQVPMNRPEGFIAHHLIWVTRGYGMFRIGEDVFRLGCGEGVFIRSGIPHSYHVCEGDSFSTAWLTFLINDDFFSCLGIEDHFSFSVPNSFSSDFAELRECANTLPPLLRSAKGYVLVAELLSGILLERDSISDRVYRVLESRYAQAISLDDVAEALGMDKYVLCRLYKKEKGKTVVEELTDIRIHKAKHLLRYSSESIQSIGQQCGFENASYFDKRFRMLVGCTPTVYRSMRAQGNVPLSSAFYADSDREKGNRRKICQTN